MDRFVEDFIDQVRLIDTIEGFRQTLDSLRDRLGVTHFAYLGVHIPSAGIVDPFTICSYSDDWVAHYQLNNYLAIDPVTRSGLARMLPFEWREFEQPKYRRFFGEAADFGIGSQGLTIPIHGANGELALVSVSSDMPGREWARHLRGFRHRLHLMGIYYHATMTANVLIGREQQDIPLLTPREIECLEWTAKGKTAWDVSKILNISERTVIFHLSNAKVKLGVYSKNHAIVKSIMLGLINP